MSATVEALIGAVFIDSGKSLEAVKVAMGGLGLIDVEEVSLG
jgi:dsRNA-specific ribonuclease